MINGKSKWIGRLQAIQELLADNIITAKDAFEFLNMTDEDFALRDLRKDFDKELNDIIKGEENGN